MLWRLVLARYFFDRMALDEDGVKQAAALGYLRHCARTLKDYIFSNLNIISRMHDYTAAQGIVHKGVNLHFMHGTEL